MSVSNTQHDNGYMDAAAKQVDWLRCLMMADEYTMRLPLVGALHGTPTLAISKQSDLHDNII